MTFKAGCTCCSSPHREAIDAAIVGAVPVRDIAKAHALTKSAVFRHRRHISQSIVKAAARAEVKYENTLLGDAQDLRARTLRLLDVAEETKDTRLQAVLFGQVRENIRLLTELTAQPKASEADAQRVLEWVAKEHDVPIEEVVATCEQFARIQADLIAGRHVPHTPKELPGGREHYLEESRKAAAVAPPPPPAVVAVAPPQSEAVPEVAPRNFGPETPAPDPDLPPPLPGPWTLTI